MHDSLSSYLSQFSAELSQEYGKIIVRPLSINIVMWNFFGSQSLSQHLSSSVGSQKLAARLMILLWAFWFKKNLARPIWPPTASTWRNRPSLVEICRETLKFDLIFLCSNSQKMSENWNCSADSAIQTFILAAHQGPEWMSKLTKRPLISVYSVKSYQAFS